MNADWIGWVATAVFVGSYLCTRADALRKVQMVGAALWIGYGLLTQAAPVVTANALVLGAAAWASRRSHDDLGTPRSQRRVTSPESSSDCR